MIKAVVFDVEGVLADTEMAHFLAHKKALAEHNTLLDERTYFLHGAQRDSRTFYRYLIDAAGRAMGDGAFDAFYDMAHSKKDQYFLEALNEKTVLAMEAAHYAIDFADKMALRRAVASGASREALDKILRIIGMTDKFEFALSKKDVARRKPAPDVYVKAVELLGLRPDECMAVEDSYIGVCAAKDAGLACVAIPNRYTQQHDFSRADAVVKSLSQITALNLLHDGA